MDSDIQFRARWPLVNECKCFLIKIFKAVPCVVTFEFLRSNGQGTPVAPVKNGRLKPMAEVEFEQFAIDKQTNNVLPRGSLPPLKKCKYFLLT